MLSTTCIICRVLLCLAEVGVSLVDVGCWFGDGCSVNGVRPDEKETGNNVWAELRKRGAIHCLKWWGACHRLNLCLKDQWVQDDTKELLIECDKFFRSVSQCLDMSSGMQDD